MKRLLTTDLINSVLLIVILATLNNIRVTINEMDTTIEHSYYIQTITDPTKVRDMRVTAYLPTGNKTALGDNVVVGRTAAVSSRCNDLLGEEVYVKGHGVRYVNDLTASWLDDKFGVCTLDLAVPNKEEANKVGNKIRTVVRLSPQENEDVKP